MAAPRAYLVFKFTGFILYRRRRLKLSIIIIIIVIIVTIIIFVSVAMIISIIRASNTFSIFRFSFVFGLFCLFVFFGGGFGTEDDWGRGVEGWAGPWLFWNGWNRVTRLAAATQIEYEINTPRYSKILEDTRRYSMIPPKMR